ncbi:MAG: hypothetical protein J5I59_04615 [Saprospiraceae bacterium]|nr:hypothetical protein [Saprospiraceae bacterium]
MRFIICIVFIGLVSICSGQKNFIYPWQFGPHLSFNGYNSSTQSGFFYQTDFSLTTEYQWASRFTTGIRTGITLYRNEVKKGFAFSGGAFMRTYLWKGLNLPVGLLYQDKNQLFLTGGINYGVPVGANFVIEPGIEYGKFLLQKGADFIRLGIGFRFGLKS